MGIEGQMGELVEAGEWERVRKLLESTVVEVDAYDGLLLRQAVERTDLEGVRMLLQEWKAEVGFLEPISPPPTGPQFREVVALLLEAAEANPNLGREELLHRLMQMAIRYDFLELGKHLLDDLGVDVNAHGGMYVRMALAIWPIYAPPRFYRPPTYTRRLPKLLAREFFSRKLSEASLEQLPWETFFSFVESTEEWANSYESLLLSMAEKVRYQDHAREIATALEVRDWVVLRKMKEEINKGRDKGWLQSDDWGWFEVKEGWNRRLHDFCHLWRVWDRLGCPKEKLRRAWERKASDTFFSHESTDGWQSEAEVESYISRFLSDPDSTVDG